MDNHLKRLLIQYIKRYGPLKVKDVHYAEMVLDDKKYDIAMYERMDDNDYSVRDVRVDIVKKGKK